MDKRYNHQQFEGKIYKEWEKLGVFSPDKDLSKKPFCIIMPPPNANGTLHIGHAMFVAVEDLMTRYARMRGLSALWLPGADHAGILTQVVFERELEKKGKTRFDLGREEFWKQCFEFSQKNKRGMYDQFRLLGASCDWTREKFTLDEDVTKIAYDTFYKLYKDDLVYRDWRMVSWCPRCLTALSDLEVNYKEEKSKLWYIKYPYADGSGEIIIATTRPETMLGDTAVAVNPKDKRYKDKIGKEVILPLVGKKIPVIADNVVDPKFGTGAVKITPAHDPDDFATGKRHDLEVIQIIGFDGKMTDGAGDFAGLKVKKAREQIVEKLEKERFLEKEEQHQHRVSYCERCKAVIEPLVSLQWFIKTKPLAQKAIKAVREKKTKIVPKRFEKTYFHWMDNIRDWCISRQLWWGHQLPIWYCGSKGISELQTVMNPNLVKKTEPEGCGKIYIGEKPPKKCSCGKSNFIRDPDTFDTWFSSGQWPYSVLGYPDSDDFKKFYPTSVMETGYEILFFWVARMMMLGLYRTGKVPFKTVYLHGLVRDVFGSKMSKSRPETTVDPTKTINNYGADSLRMALLYGASAGNDVIVGEDKIRSMRNFTNKIWNAARFITMIANDVNWKIYFNKKVSSKDDQEILRKKDEVIVLVTEDFESYKYGQALEKIYQFFWHEFCDDYLEKTKDKRTQALPTLINVLVDSLKLLHPFAPFITESIYEVFREKLEDQKIFSSKMLISSSWPEVKVKK